MKSEYLFFFNHTLYDEIMEYIEREIFADVQKRARMVEPQTPDTPHYTQGDCARYFLQKFSILRNREKLKKIIGGK